VLVCYRITAGHNVRLQNGRAMEVGHCVEAIRSVGLREGVKCWENVDERFYERILGINARVWLRLIVSVVTSCSVQKL
jgi:hypothetical protein